MPCWRRVARKAQAVRMPCLWHVMHAESPVRRADGLVGGGVRCLLRSEEHTSELQSRLHLHFSLHDALPILRPEFADFDAELRFGLGDIVVDEPAECHAGDVLRGKLKPFECPAFGTLCTPSRPLGAPMVSSEGACAAYLDRKSTRLNSSHGYISTFPYTTLFRS